jgi:hypothetical protein
MQIGDPTQIEPMPTQNMTQDNLILRQEIIGSRRFSNYWWAIAVSIGGLGFLLAGLSSYLKVNLIPLSNSTELQFVPQGVALLFYGVMGCLLALYLWLIILWNVGGGYNEFNKEKGLMTIFRHGYPGKNRVIELSSPLTDVQAVRAEIKEGFNPKRELYVKVRQKRDIPLTRVGRPISLSQLENQAAELARFLGVPLEGL